MACGSGCCGPSKDQSVDSNTGPSPTPTETPAEIEIDSCCDDAGSCAEPVEADDSLQADQSLTDKNRDNDDDCQKGCCSSTPASEAAQLGSSQAVVKDCCGPPEEDVVTCAKPCCGSADETTMDTTASKPNNVEVTADDDKKGCCSAQEEVVVDSCCPPEPKSEDDYSQACCGPNTDAKAMDVCGPQPTDVTDDCCAPRLPVAVACNEGCCDTKAEPRKKKDSTIKRDIGADFCTPQPQPTDDCSKGCCSSSPSNQEVKVTEDKAPSCCEGKTSPCCDSTCIDRLALRECTAKKSFASRRSSKATASDNSCTGGENGKPCRDHARTVRRTYQAKLEALGCICRALLALGQESCCAPRERPVQKRSSIRSSRSRVSIDSCCVKGAPVTACGSTGRSGDKKASRSAGYGVKGDGCSKGCCAKPKAPSVAGSCADSCCDATEATDAIVETSKRVVGDVTNDVTNDVERGLSGKEHVVLSISGMTCTGCETKLRRTLATVGAVKNLRTSLVLARAEFDLDMGAGSVVEVIKHLERTTEFKCEKITSQGASIDVLAPGNTAAFISQPWPEGVTDIRAVDKTTVHVEFDAEVVGARDLVDKGWDTPVELAQLRADPTLEAGSKHVRNMGLITLLSIALTIPVLVMAWAPLPERELAYGSASLALATIVQVVVAGPFYPKALKSLIFSRVIEMDLLIVLSTSAAYIFSVVSFGFLVSHKPLSTGEFFETSTLLVTLIMVGRYVSALARQKAVESISIRSLQASTALVVDRSGEEKEIDARLLQYGDVFKVVPESRVPTDGTVISGSSELDESMMTGESKPVEKYVGSSLIAGSINGSGTLNVRLTRLPGDNTISNIAGMVDEAKLSKPKIQDIADRVASYFVPVVVGITIITFSIWIAVGIAVRKQSGSEATIQAVTYAITVLIVSCPCAIGLAVPMVIVIASGVAAERGVIFKSADSIEVAYKTSHVVFDKTGTITNGKLTIAQEDYVADDVTSTKGLILGLVGSIKHPVSAAVAAHLKAQGISPSTVSDPKALTGKGVEATVSGRKLRAGNSRWLGFSTDPRVEPILTKGYTVFCFTIDGSLAAVFGLEDSIRPDALETIATLQKSGIAVHVLSGDDDGAVRGVATQLGIPDGHVRSRCTPADKQAYIQTLMARRPHTTTETRRGPRKSLKEPVVIFCGDGTNDAVALAQATIGVHMNEGTDVAKSAADVVLMRPSLAGILTAIAISRKAIHRIAFNFGWSFAYNLVAILLGAGAFVHARIPPEFAGLGELASVLPVIAAAVLLRWSKV
ncbi:Copper-translocating P-type ATPase [Colletotrichum higginsianum IMI 349063]|uniref:Copper-translocating P-type ATPase n=1 Tax=Colletotrichum higginsianum (strain IMI 349063) TaxID=759273 RepID=A0A1B7XWX1_COLHI|nr:Copper-translocating P-type ATPase [Colletotrichum higginsianum IMI 349063]OBR04273.1 Copper-translocating P-type ATPase [Colletotrichum higginsianum IMI 349063]